MTRFKDAAPGQALAEVDATLGLSLLRGLGPLGALLRRAAAGGLLQIGAHHRSPCKNRSTPCQTTDAHIPIEMEGA